MASRPGLHDLSPLVTEAIAVFPGDTPYRRHVLRDFASGSSYALSAIESTVHLGTHCDAPSHYHPSGRAIDACDLDRYLGPCQVVSVRLAPGERIVPDHLASVELRAPRVLFRTGSFPDPERWRDDFNSLSPELVRWLSARGVVLVGIDTPSVDPANDGKLETHQAIFAADLAVIEGLVLDGVADGLYTLIALPLRLAGADASPVRAILLPAGVTL